MSTTNSPNPVIVHVPVDDEPIISIELVTPEKAREFLGYNLTNRGIRSRVVQIYALDMAQGMWKFNGDPVRFARNGQLLDGQHRLAAIIESGTPQKMLIIRNLYMSAQLNMDSGIKRNFADYLKFLGEVNVHMYGAIIGAVTRYEEGGNIRSNNTSHAEMEKTYQKYPELKDAISVVQRANAAVKCGYVAGGLTWFLLNAIDPEECATFFDRLTAMDNHQKGEPIFALRRTLIANAPTGRQRTLPPHNIAALMIKAWNKWRDGEECEVLMWRGGGPSPEAFPEPH